MTGLNWAHVGPSILATFLASAVECVEALTVVLAVGATRGWRDALLGMAAALGILTLMVVALGATLTRIPLDVIQLAVGALLLLFGLRWLRKAILRAGGVIPLRDEAAAYLRETAKLRAAGTHAGLDRVGFGTAFQIVMLEGIEVVFIVIGIGAGGTGLMWPASLGALAALLVVAVIGTAVHRPLARVPENSLKFAVGVLAAAFGSFWMGEGGGIDWPGADWSILLLVVGYGAAALVAVRLCQRPATVAA